MLNKLKFSRLTLNAFTVASLFLLDKVFAFVRASIVNRQFSDPADIPILDAFNVANNLPDVLFALISGGALAMALTAGVGALFGVAA